MPKLSKQSTSQRRKTLTNAMQRLRRNSSNRIAEPILDTSVRHVFHVDSTYCTREQECDTQARSLARADPIYRAREQEWDTRARAAARADPSYQVREQERNTAAHLVARADPSYRIREQERDTRAHSLRRSIRILRVREQRSNTVLQRTRREHNRECTSRRISSLDHRVRQYRSLPSNRRMESLRQAKRNAATHRLVTSEERADHLQPEINGNRERVLQHYFEIIKQGPTEICICCGGLWFPSDMKKLRKQKLLERYGSEFIAKAFYLSNKFPSEIDTYKFCQNCHRGITHGNIPNICLANGLDFPIIPECLQGLECIEQRLIAPRIPFMQIRALGCDRQCGLKGACVNVPISVNTTISCLPRTFDETHVIQVHLKRRLQYNHSFLVETIRPFKVFTALQYLIQRPLYISDGVILTENWLEQYPNDRVPFAVTEEDRQIVDRFLETNSVEDVHNIDQFNPENLNPVVQETLLENIPLENIALAPGEGQRPSDLILDTHAEELSFPSIYCGEPRRTPQNLTYSKIARSEIRRYDRRCATVEKLLFTYKKYELLSIKNSISVCLRKKSLGTTAETVHNLLNENYVDNLIQHDDGYKIFKNLRSSPSHWESEKKKVIAMIRQFGIPTFFITLSAAETKWSQLICILSKVVNKREMSPDEADNLEFSTKARLIRTDPVTCSRYFDHRFRALFKLFKKPGGIFDDSHVVNYYYRVEFQQRGSPHVHGLYWLHNAPQLDLSDSTTFLPVENFIDKYVSTAAVDSDLEEYLVYQKHSHARSCLREIRGQTFCRFGMPYPPMDKTCILTPLDESEISDVHKQNLDKVKQFLNESAKNTSITNTNFDRFLDNLHISKESYIMAFRATLKKPAVFLKRSLDAIMLNAYNPCILNLHRANMDIQYVLDAYACCGYIINYINKSRRGISKLMREVMDEVSYANYSVRQKLHHLGNKFIHGLEISAQEAAYNVLGLRLSESSNAEVYINTCPPNERVRIVKSKNQLQKLPPNSTNIFVPNLLDHYEQRPNSLENISLAEFAAYYRFSSLHPSSHDSQNGFEDNAEVAVDESLLLRDSSGVLRKRTKPCVIRYRRYKMVEERDHYFREQIMLFMPWRNEDRNILQQNCEVLCQENIASIVNVRQKFNCFDNDDALDEALRDAQIERFVGTINDAQDNIDPALRPFQIPNIAPNVPILEIEVPRDNNTRLIKLPPIIPEEDFSRMIRTLNQEQQLYLNHVLHNIKSGKKFYEFVSGGAGTGKSRLITVLYNALVKRLNSRPGSSPDEVKVILCAPTGKAAFNISGATLHSVFSLPANQSNAELRPAAMLPIHYFPGFKIFS